MFINYTLISFKFAIMIASSDINQPVYDARGIMIVSTEISSI